MSTERLPPQSHQIEAAVKDLVASAVKIETTKDLEAVTKELLQLKDKLAPAAFVAMAEFIFHHGSMTLMKERPSQQSFHKSLPSVSAYLKWRAAEPQRSEKALLDTTTVATCICMALARGTRP